MAFNRRAAKLIFAMALAAGCQDVGHEGHAGDGESWDEFAHRFVEETLAAHPAFAVAAGRHEFDGQLPDWSRDGIAAEIARLHAARAIAAGVDPARLSARQAFQRSYVLAVIDRTLFWLETAEWPFKNPAFYLDSTFDSLDPNVYVAREYAPLDQRARSFIQYANRLPRAADQIIANLETPLPRTYVDYGISAFGGLATFFESDLDEAFAELEDEALRAAVYAAGVKAAAAMNRVSAWLSSQRPSSNDNFAIGAEMLQRMVRTIEGVDVDLDGLRSIAVADLERNLADLEAACAEFAPGKSIKECVALIYGDKPEGGAVEGAREQIDLLRAFLVEKDLVTIPSEEEALVAISPPYYRANAAYIDIPGPYESNLPTVYYISPPNPNWTAAEQRAYIPGENDLLFTTVHEIWPGHFLQYLHARSLDDEVARLFSSYASGEGWAHYAEELMWEAGLGEGDPGVRIGQLLNALLRSVRFLSAIDLHTGRMTVEESEQMFREKAFQDPANARQQASRGTYDPAYLNYTMGKLMIRKLRDDWTSKRGDRLSWKAFHDRFLSFGSPPIPLVRSAMLANDDGELF